MADTFNTDLTKLAKELDLKKYPEVKKVVDTLGKAFKDQSDDMAKYLKDAQKVLAASQKGAKDKSEQKKLAELYDLVKTDQEKRYGIVKNKSEKPG